jgi:indole-3-glycerol phosphate synthase
MEGTPSLSENEKALVRATGGAILMIATLLQREGLMSVADLASKLGLYGAISAETCEEEGLILAAWSSMLTEVANDLSKAKKH